MKRFRWPRPKSHYWRVAYRIPTMMPFPLITANGLTLPGRNERIPATTIWYCQRCGYMTEAYRCSPPTNRNDWEREFWGYSGFPNLNKFVEPNVFHRLWVPWDCDEARVKRILDT